MYYGILEGTQIRGVRMREWNNIAGFKNYIFFASLALFFLGPLVMTNNVLADDCISYSCTGITTQHGDIIKKFYPCVDLCADDFEVNLIGIGFFCYLYPIDSNHSKRLLGTVYTDNGWGGCSVELGGKITIKLTLIQENEGLVVTLRCKPCDNCCGPDV
jgi:hypothetical protein